MFSKAFAVAVGISKQTSTPRRPSLAAMGAMDESMGVTEEVTFTLNRGTSQGGRIKAAGSDTGAQPSHSQSLILVVPFNIGSIHTCNIFDITSIVVMSEMHVRIMCRCITWNVVVSQLSLVEARAAHVRALTMNLAHARSESSTC